MIEDWKRALDNNEVVGTMLMDLSKAFDCLPHDLLISKLSAYGLTESATRLIANYLTSRKQRVRIGQAASDFCAIINGVPQGSLLFFSIFLSMTSFFQLRTVLYI